MSPAACSAPRRGAPEPADIVHRQQQFGREIRLEEGLPALLPRIETQLVRIEQLSLTVIGQRQSQFQQGVHAKHIASAQFRHVIWPGFGVLRLAARFFGGKGDAAGGVGRLRQGARCSHCGGRHENAGCPIRIGLVRQAGQCAGQSSQGRRIIGGDRDRQGEARAEIRIGEQTEAQCQLGRRQGRTRLATRRQSVIGRHVDRKTAFGACRRRGTLRVGLGDNPDAMAAGRQRAGRHDEREAGQERSRKIRKGSGDVLTPHADMRLAEKLVVEKHRDALQSRPGDRPAGDGQRPGKLFAGLMAVEHRAVEFQPQFGRLGGDLRSLRGGGRPESSLLQNVGGFTRQGCGLHRHQGDFARAAAAVAAPETQGHEMRAGGGRRGQCMCKGKPGLRGVSIVRVAAADIGARQAQPNWRMASKIQPTSTWPNALTSF